MEVNKKQIRFIVDIVDHCNLNCKGCGHFSPLASKSFLDLETFENDLRRNYGWRSITTPSIREVYRNYG